MNLLERKTHIVIALIAVVNALGYGIVIPLLFSYSHRFGLNDFQNGMLFSIFSLCQFIATPIIGRLSDRFGRKPLLIISITGTALSFLIMAWAPSAGFLFLARAIDGITAGNIPVALAVISDITRPEKRAKGFGLIGASFAFGLVFGPSIAALTVGFGIAVPFIIAAVVASLAVFLTLLLLPETNRHLGLSHKEKLFNFSHMIHALGDKHIGRLLQITLLFSLGFSLFIYAYQPLSIYIINLSPQEISINFTIFGIVGLLTQAVFIPLLAKRFGERNVLRNALFLSIFTFLSFYFTYTAIMLLIVSIAHAIVNGFVNPMIQAILSQEADIHSQGSMQGLNSSYMSIGMILGPIIGGILSSFIVPLPFLVGSVIMASCFVMSTYITRKKQTTVGL